MTVEIDLHRLPASIVIGKIATSDPDIEVVKGKFDSDHYFFKLELSPTQYTTLRLPTEVLSGLLTKNPGHRERELDQRIRDAIIRMKQPKRK